MILSITSEIWPKLKVDTRSKNQSFNSMLISGDLNKNTGCLHTLKSLNKTLLIECSKVTF